MDALVKDAAAALHVVEGTSLDPDVAQAAELLATVAGQDVEEGPDGVFRIARRTAPDRVISVVDPEARHGLPRGQVEEHADGDRFALSRECRFSASHRSLSNVSMVDAASCSRTPSRSRRRIRHVSDAR